MSIKIYNTLTRKKEEFKPIKKGRVGIYVCGPTVYDHPHIGHARSAYVFDVICRYFEYKGYKVTFVRNVTDVDDKIINKAREESKEEEDLNKRVQGVSKKYLASYHRYMDALDIRRPDHEPKATEYIDKMKGFITLLIQRGTAYESEGDVYFDVQKAVDYGKLSNQSIEMLRSGARSSPEENKKSPLDFALWKRAKEGKVSWDSPWGRGRPGWHIECSVMSLDILGDEFDIHGGGIDLVFPHHENEIAQSEGGGKKFARYWIHNGLLTINKEKMAKSLGNFVSVEDILSRYPADVLKILFLQTHYSHPVDFSWDKMEDAKKALERFYILFNKLDKESPKLHASSSKQKPDSFRIQFKQDMDDDFNTPKALAVLFEIVTYVNKMLDDGCSELKDLRHSMDIMKEMADVFGLSFLHKGTKIQGISDKEVERKIKIRLDYRKKRAYQEADKIREDLEEKGIILEDTKDGTTWRKKI